MTPAATMPYQVYADFADVPQDLNPLPDLGDKDPSTLGPPPTPEELAAQQALVGALELVHRPIVAPLRRTIKPGDKGPDVWAVKRALSKWEATRTPPLGRFHDNPTNVYGDAAVKRIQKFKHRHSMRATKQYDLATHHLLLPWFDGWSAYHMAQYHPQSKAEVSAAKLVATAMFGYHNAPRHYNNTVQGLRCQGYYEHIKPPHMWWYDDCSGFALWCGWVNGILVMGDPGGWTGSMQLYGKRVTLAQAKPGAMVFYNNPAHVGVLVDKHDGGQVVDHGHEGGPRYHTAYYREIWEVREYLGR